MLPSFQTINQVAQTFGWGAIIAFITWAWRKSVNFTFLDSDGIGFTTSTSWAQYTGTGGAPTRTAFTVGDRIYLNGATLQADNNSGSAQDLGHSGQNVRLAELALSHELAHMQDARPRPWQEAHDSIYNAEGQKIFQQWQKSVAEQQKRAAVAYQQIRE